MQHASKLLGKVTGSISSGRTLSENTDHETPAISPQSVEKVVDLFDLWKANFAGKLKNMDLSLKRAETWTLALKMLGMTESEFKLATALSLTLEWPPSAPADFYDLAANAKAHQAGYLTAAESFEAIFQAPEVDRNNPPHFGETNPQHKRDIVTWNTVLRIGSARLMTSDKKYTRPDYLKTYADVLRVALSGRKDDLVASGALKPVPPLKQAQIADKGASKEFALDAIQKIRHKHGWV